MLGYVFREYVHRIQDASFNFSSAAMGFLSHPGPVLWRLRIFWSQKKHKGFLWGRARLADATAFLELEVFKGWALVLFLGV